VVTELSEIETGGAQILSYQIDYDMNTNNAEWNELKGFSANDISLSTIKDNLIFNAEYMVRYRAKNIYGWSEYSDITSIYTIMAPDQPEAVTSMLVGVNVVFSWVEPDSRGADILYYHVRVQSSNEEFVLDSTYCNEVLVLSCSFPMSVLNDIDGAYNLPLNSLIKAKVSATNE
jgi:hypothetical protein